MDWSAALSARDDRGNGGSPEPLYAVNYLLVGPQGPLGKVIVKITLIAAVSRNGVIGRDGGLPWHLPADLRRFKQVTRGHQVVMGRRTYESMPGPLPNRRNIVVSRRPDYRPAGVEVAHSLEEAIALAESAAGSADETLFILGGAVLYEAALPIADRLDLTCVDAEVEGDTRFPDFDASDWREIERVEHPADADHAFGFTVRVLER